MLAAIDDESDSEPIQDPKLSERNALSAVAGNIRRVREPDGVKDDVLVGQKDDEDVEDGEESDEPPTVPRGRIAARLNGQTLGRRGVSSTSEREGDQDAYARIKKKLLLKDATNNHESSKATKSKETTPVMRRSKHQGTSDLLSDESTSRTSSPGKSRDLSPGLFLTPKADSKTRSPSLHSVNSRDSDSSLPTNPRSNSRFMELVAKKRAEREARQAAEDRKKDEKAARQRSFEKALSQDASSGSDLSNDDKAADRRLTQHSRPTRKASKKALEEMNRETQRMSRNMQLAHQAKTKKKISKQSLLDRFKFRTSTTTTVEVPQNLGPSTASSASPSDLEGARTTDSPPTSPVAPDESFSASRDSVVDKHPAAMTDEVQPSVDEDENLPSILDILNQPAQKLDKGKGKAVDHSETENAPAVAEGQKTTFKQRPIRIRLPKPMTDPGDIDLDSNSESEVLHVQKPKTSKADIFDRLPAGKVQEGRSMQTLRALAHLNSPEKLPRSKKASMTQAEMQRSLQKRARQQAMEERRAKIEDLKRRGILIQTAEERERDQVEVEDLVDKARREADEIMQKEKKAAKKEKLENGEGDGLNNSSDEDEDYQADADNSDIELSGSDEEEPQIMSDEEDQDSEGEQLEDSEVGGVNLEESRETNSLIDNEASEDSQNDDEDEATTEDDDEEEEDFRQPQVHRRRTKMVIDDDDDDAEKGHEPPASAYDASSAPDVPIFAAPAGPQPRFSPMGLTQAFAATMADTQTQDLDGEDEQDSLAFLGPPPDPKFPIFDETDSLQMVEDSQNGLVAEQNTNASNQIDLHFTQSQIRSDAFADTQDQVVASQISEVPDPTQDVGFMMSSPAPERFVSDPPSTIDTVILPGAVESGSPIRKKRGRLQRRLAVKDPSTVDETPPANGQAVAENQLGANAFDLMNKARRRNKSEIDKFDKKKSDAKDMVEEQAQESEDEYAGIGGASDDESGGEEDAFVQEMIDRGEVNVNERELAAHYA